jgi:hypothetical protein
MPAMVCPFEDAVYRSFPDLEGERQETNLVHKTPLFEKKTTFVD